MFEALGSVGSHVRTVNLRHQCPDKTCVEKMKLTFITLCF